MGRRLKDADEVLTSLAEQTNKMIFEIYDKKTQRMIVS